jgi:hypothetical protein
LIEHALGSSFTARSCVRSIVQRSLSQRALAAPRWAALDDAALLALRFRDLKLKITDSPVHADTLQLAATLERRGLRFAPHVWFSTEWFSPDGVPGIAVPFFLGHPRLLRLERRIIGVAEGGNPRWRRRLLRHELGHAVDTAYGLRRRRDWQRTFGLASARYGRVYAVKPRSKDHVLHLEHWYAQSHPTEDFAETFAVWLGAKKRWRAQYANWPALEKLEFVDALMTELAGRAPAKRDRSLVAPLTDNNRTLREHYRRRMSSLGGGAQRYDASLLRVFARRATSAAAPAERFLRESKAQLLPALVRRTRAHPYVVHQVLRAVRRRTRALDLVLRSSKREAAREVTRLHERLIADLLRRNDETYYL